MKFCPNFSDPSVKEQWDLITNDPELGKIEAMREFMEAQIANRPVGTPEQVKEKLKGYEENTNSSFLFFKFIQ